MTPLDFISLEEAKKSLVVHPSVTEFDDLITDLIYSAVEWIEKKTSYMLYEREITESFRNGERIFYFPVTLPEIENVTFYDNPLSKTVCLSSGRSVNITMTVGYADPSQAPRVFKDACYFLLTAWFDDRELGDIKLPQNIDYKINQFRRDASI